MTDEIRKTLSDPKPFYALAGAGDLAAEKLKDAPALLNEMAGTVTTIANRIAEQAPEQIAKVQAMLAEASSGLDPKSMLDPRAARESLKEAMGRADTQALRDKAQTLALTQVGRMLEAAGKAVETYDELAERGKGVVGRYRGEPGAAQDAEVTVVVEQVVVEEVDEVPAQHDARPLIEDAAGESATAEPKPRKNPAAPRKRTTPPKKDQS